MVELINLCRLNIVRIEALLHSGGETFLVEVPEAKVDPQQPMTLRQHLQVLPCHVHDVHLSLRDL
jgi:hypothetical protein